MGKKQLGVVIMLFSILILGACSNYKFKPTTAYEVQDFEFTNHRGEEVSLESLKGKPWLAMFIFTNCNSICLPMTHNMTEVQQILVDKGVEDYNIVAFSVDPDRDSPEVLAEYLSRYSVPDESKWHLLTGYDQTFIEQFGLKSFKTFIKAATGDSDQVTHMNRFYLVDEKGVTVKDYSGASEEVDGVPIDTIAIDLQTLIEERLGK